MNFCSDAKPKQANLENGQRRITSLRKRVRQISPTLFFGIVLIIAWIARACVAESVSALANLFVLFLATVATLLVLNQRLPLQNIIALAIILALFSGATLLGASALKVLVLPPVVNEKFLHLPAWAAPLLWTVALVNARGIAKLFLHTMRKKSNYGIALITLSALVVASLNLRADSAWQTFIVQFALAITALIATTPWFLDKRSVEFKPDFQPLAIMILLLFW